MMTSPLLYCNVQTLDVDAGLCTSENCIRFATGPHPLQQLCTHQFFIRLLQIALICNVSFNRLVLINILPLESKLLVEQVKLLHNIDVI